MQTSFPAYHGDQPYVFVCYAHDDACVVFPELQTLRKLGVHIYFDEGISRGHEWTQGLGDAIDRCSDFLYFVSPASVASRNCRNEVQYALDQEKSPVSIHLEMTSLPGGLKLSLGARDGKALVRCSVDWPVCVESASESPLHDFAQQNPGGDA